MHFIDVGFNNSCSGSVDSYLGKTVLYGLTENDQEIDIIFWKENLDGSIVKVINDNLTEDQLREIKQIFLNKKQKLCGLDFTSIKAEKIKRKELHAKK